MNRKKLSGHSKMLNGFVEDWNIRLNDFWLKCTELEAVEALFTEIA